LILIKQLNQKNAGSKKINLEALSFIGCDGSCHKHVRMLVLLSCQKGNEGRHYF
jgi:hypothetical protein